MAENAEKTPLVLSDGMLHFAVRRGDATTEHAIDVLILRMTCDECVAAHALQTDEHDCYIVTAGFLIDLAARIAAVGVEGCTPSLARQLWATAVQGIDALQKKTNETPSSPTGSTSTPEG